MLKCGLIVLLLHEIQQIIIIDVFPFVYVYDPITLHVAEAFYIGPTWQI